MESRFRFRLRHRTVRWAWFAAWAAFGACGGGVFDAYRSAHPGWQPALPDAPGGVEEVVAALHAPDAVPGIRVELAELAIFDLTAQPWRSLDPVAVGGAATAPDAAIAVIAERRCRVTAGLQAQQASRVDYYLVRGERLEAYAHSEFRAGCIVRESFRAARSDSAGLESALTEHIQGRYGPRRLDLSQLYRRGLAYVEAGRIAEAHSLLAIGERGYRAAWLASRTDRDAQSSLGDVTRLRERLHRALGREP